jgi:hypothetical protein
MVFTQAGWLALCLTFEVAVDHTHIDPTRSKAGRAYLMYPMGPLEVV